MARKFSTRFTGRDYLAMGISVLLAFLVWLIHNLSLRYSYLVKCPVAVSSELDGYAGESENSAYVAARCEMTGFDIVKYQSVRGNHPRKLRVKPVNLHKNKGEFHYMSQEDLVPYFHDIFGDDAKLEYFVTDTLFFRFKQMNYKKVPVRANARLDFKPQYMASSDLKIVPDSILIYGNKDAVDCVETVATEFIELSGLNGEVYGEARIEHLKGVRFSSDKVEYSLAVTRYVSAVVTLPVTLVNVPPGVRVQVLPYEAELECRCVFPGAEDLDGVRIVVDYNDFVSSLSGRCTARVEGLPSSVLDFSLTPWVFECVVL